MLAVGRRPEPLDDGGDLVEIGEIERLVGSDRQSDAVRSQRNAADQLEDLGLPGTAAVDAVIDGDLEHVEACEVRTGPFGDGGTVADADGGRPRFRRS